MVFVEDIENFAADLSTAQLVDLSTYGDANPDRDELALYNYLFKRDADNNDTQITLDNTSPLTATYWQFDLPVPDGLFVYNTFGFPIWAAGSYTLNNCVYYSGSYYKATTTTSSTPGADADWELLTDILAQVTDLANSNVTVTQGYAFSTSRAEAGPIGDMLEDFAPKILAGSCKNWNEGYQAFLGTALIESAWMDFRRQSYVQAQKTMDFVDQQFAAQAA